MTNAHRYLKPFLPLAGLLPLVIALTGCPDDSNNNNMTVVPYLSGLSQADAQSALLVTGLVAERGRAESFAEAIRLLLSDGPLRDRLARAGRVEALRYSVSAHAEAVASVYRGLIET